MPLAAPSARANPGATLPGASFPGYGENGLMATDDAD
jgi:hypothetical protein